jgi:hypothetical protein
MRQFTITKKEVVNRLDVKTIGKLLEDIREGESHSSKFRKALFEQIVNKGRDAIFDALEKYIDHYDEGERNREYMINIKAYRIFDAEEEKIFFRNLEECVYIFWEELKNRCEEDDLLGRFTDKIRCGGRSGGYAYIKGMKELIDNALDALENVEELYDGERDDDSWWLGFKEYSKDELEDEAIRIADDLLYFADVLNKFYELVMGTAKDVIEWHRNCFKGRTFEELAEMDDEELDEFFSDYYGSDEDEIRALIENERKKKQGDVRDEGHVGE